jgi:hypothetical protein
MPTATTFSTKITIPDLIEPSKAVGAHLAAKLDCFCTDERTLTDELCDMLCIWIAEMTKGAGSVGPSFLFSLSKTTSAEEVKNGADLELVVSSPLGMKRCLIQAKVFDPNTLKLRCDSKIGWKKLRAQLIAMRNEVGPLAFLLVYLPGRLLNGNVYTFSTYEQGYLPSPAGYKQAYFGATLIPVDDLLGPKGRWRYPKQKVRHDNNGTFTNGIPFWRFLLEVLLCRRGTWSHEVAYVSDQRITSFRRLVMSATEIEPMQWEALQNSGDQWLPQQGGQP